MEYVRLGASGLEVSKIILGCMSYGDPGRGGHPWTLPVAESRPFFVQALEAGITTFDTADVYSAGAGEEVVGEMLGELARRDEVVIATKVHGRMRPGPNGAGLSRGHIMSAIDDSLRRLKTDYVDLYQIHRWDPGVPIEETMEALHDVVRAGKARYIGASSMRAWQFVTAQYTADLHGWTRFVSMQDQYNLLMREEEREMHPYCAAEGIGVIPWSPLARGRLTRDWDTSTPRAEADRLGRTLYLQQEDASRRIVAAVGEIADARGVPRAQIALSWILGRSQVTAPIVGATRAGHLDDAVTALGITLDDDEVHRLEEHYRPVEPEGF